MRKRLVTVFDTNAIIELEDTIHRIPVAAASLKKEMTTNSEIFQSFQDAERSATHTMTTRVQ